MVIQLLLNKWQLINNCGKNVGNYHYLLVAVVAVGGGLSVVVVRFLRARGFLVGLGVLGWVWAFRVGAVLVAPVGVWCLVVGSFFILQQ